MCTHIAHQCCDQLTAVKTGVSSEQYHLTVSRVQRDRVLFFEVIQFFLKNSYETI